jgi:hypothetical protein
MLMQFAQAVLLLVLLQMNKMSDQFSDSIYDGSGRAGRFTSMALLN